DGGGLGGPELRAGDRARSRICRRLRRAGERAILAVRTDAVRVSCRREVARDGVNDARRAVALAPEYAEAHATLGYVLSAAGRSDEALAAARRAIALQPQQWSHRFRLGHAAWGEERLSALTECLRLYPPFPFAYFQMAMVHVARQKLDTAQRVLEEGVAVQDGMGPDRSRFPASGLHWMLGTIKLSRRDADGALVEFGRELASAGQA